MGMEWFVVVGAVVVLSGVQVQIWNFWVQVHRQQQKYNKMSGRQTLDLTSPAQQPHIPTTTQFKQHSSHDSSLLLNDLNTSDPHQPPLSFLQHYTKLDQSFPLQKLKRSPFLSSKHFKQSTYYGQLHNGKKHGNGILQYNSKRIYQGQWINDVKKGKGSQLFPNGSIYRGAYVGGKPHGIGTYIWLNGERYDGQWVHGFKEGSGMWRGSFGDSYKGEWKNGKPQGYGTHTFANGDTYEGQFKACFKHGEGIQRFKNGDIYKGKYENGKPSGYGQYYWANGSIFKGNFVNGLREGKGKWKRGMGINDHYEGQYKNDKKWGKGVYTWASGNVYKGNYEGDMRNGYGQMLWVNGSHYKGNWVNGIQHGQGQIYVPHQGFKKGRFDNNVIVEVWQESINNGTKASRGKSRKKSRTRVQTQQQVGANKQRTWNSHQKQKQKGSLQNLRVKTSIKKPKQPTKIQQHSLAQLKPKQAKTSPSAFNKPSSTFFNSTIPQKMRPGIVSTIPHLSQPKRQKIHSQVNHINHNSRLNDSLKHPSEFNTSLHDYNLTKAQINKCENGSRERLLHSSFYLYKLNHRHNLETLKNVKRLEGEQRASVLFMGKLYPQDE